jgi:hypothetical protein
MADEEPREDGLEEKQEQERRETEAGGLKRQEVEQGEAAEDAGVDPSQGEATSEVDPEEATDESEDDSSDDEYFDVEEILGCEQRQGGTLYHLKYADYGPKHNTWEPYSNLSKELQRQVDAQGPYPNPRREEGEAN